MNRTDVQLRVVRGARLPGYTRTRSGPDLVKPWLDLDLARVVARVQEAVDRYVTRTNYPMPPMEWYFAYNLFRAAGITQGIKKRVIDGTASSAHAQAMSDRVRPLAERAYHFALAAGMPA